MPQGSRFGKTDFSIKVKTKDSEKEAVFGFPVDNKCPVRLTGGEDNSVFFIYEYKIPRFRKFAKDF